MIYITNDNKINGNEKQIKKYVENSLMIVTVLNSVIGYDKASQLTHYALENDISLKEACLKLNFLTEKEFNKLVSIKQMI